MENALYYTEETEEIEGNRREIQGKPGKVQKNKRQKLYHYREIQVKYREYIGKNRRFHPSFDFWPIPRERLADLDIPSSTTNKQQATINNH